MGRPLVLAPPNRRVALSALRMRLTEWSGGARWSVNPDGIIGRALIVPAPSTVSFPLTLSGEASLRARAMLLPHDWRDGRGDLRATVTATHRDGGPRELWAGVLRTADRRGHPRGLEVACRLPSSVTGLRLCVGAGGTEPRAVARAVWLEPVIDDGGAPDPGPGPDSPPASRTVTSLTGRGWRLARDRRLVRRDR